MRRDEEYRHDQTIRCTRPLPYGNMHSYCLRFLRSKQVSDNGSFCPSMHTPHRFFRHNHVPRRIRPRDKAPTSHRSVQQPNQSCREDMFPVYCIKAPGLRKQYPVQKQCFPALLFLPHSGKSPFREVRKTFSQVFYIASLPQSLRESGNVRDGQMQNARPWQVLTASSRGFL